MNTILNHFLLTAGFCFGISGLVTASSIKNNVQCKPRVIVTTDPELDDNNSMIRFILYSTDYKIEGLIYASSKFHWSGDGKGTKQFIPGREYTNIGITTPLESWRWKPGQSHIEDVLDAYAKSYPNLKIQDAGYPTPAYLRSKYRVGNIEFDGDYSKDSPGSELIKQVILDDNEQPVYVQAWGGCSTIARALKSIADIYGNTSGWKNLYEKVCKKMIILMSGDQDDTYAKYIKPFWPDIKVQNFTTLGVDLVYGVQSRATVENTQYYTSEWVKNNMLCRGPLGALERVWGDGKQMSPGDKTDYFGLSGYTDDQLRKQGYMVWMPVQPKGSFLAEGDDLCFLNLINNGLDAWKDDTYGGWAGVNYSVPDNIKKTWSYFPSTTIQKECGFPDYTAAVQNDLAARLEWSVTSNYKSVNHEPVITGPESICAKPGQKVILKCKVSDPDGNRVSLKWYQYHVGTYKGSVVIANPNSSSIKIMLPSDAKSGETLHFVLEGTDNGTPALTHYHRVIITVL